MSDQRPPPSFIEHRVSAAALACRNGWLVLRTRGPNQVKFWFIALLVGIVAGLVTVGFRIGISTIQTLAYGVDDIALASAAAEAPWWLVLCLPILGGLIVGQILHRFTDNGRVRSVADVIEGAAMHDGRVEKRAGLASAMASLITLSTGGSSGREGPVVHLAGVISTWVSDRMNANGITGRDLLGCAVAAAVSASFNAPIAGALFALEVILRHFAVHAFAPIVIASVAGSVINRLILGGGVEFDLGLQSELQFYVELPAFLILGVVSGLVAVAFIQSIFLADDAATHLRRRTGLPRWAMPGVSGALLGLIALQYPHIIGVGYETTNRALSGDLILHEVLVFVVIKTIAVAITMAGRMGGGVFSPALMVGALTGLAFGLIATAIFPAVSGSPTLYALAGLGAVSAAVIGSPISTTLIVFELTGDWQTGLAVMVAVSISTALASRMIDRSFFLAQLERRGQHLAAGPQAYLLAMFRVSAVMQPVPGPHGVGVEAAQAMVDKRQFIRRSATLEQAMPAFDRTGQPFLPVVDADADGRLEVVGVLFHLDALKAYAKALAATAAEEHG